MFRFINLPRTWLALILGIASAALAVAGVETGSAGWLGWIALVPVLIPLLLFKDRYAPAGLAGLGFGAGLGGGLFRWLIIDSRWVEWVTNVLSFVVLGLVWSWLVWRHARLPAPAGRTSTPTKPKRLQPLLPSRVDAAAAWAGSVAHLRIAMVTAASWTVLEWARGLIMPAWNPLGLAIAGNLPLLQLAKATGPAGLSTMLVFANVIVLTSVRRLLREPGRMSWTGRFDVTATLAAIFLCAVAGFYSLAHPAEGILRRKVFCASAKDGNVASLVALSKAAAPPDFDLLVWREAAFNPADYSKLSELGIGKTTALFSGVTGAPGRGLIGSRTVLPGAVTNLFAPLNNVAFFAPFSTAPNRNMTPFNYRDVTWLPLLNWQAGTPPLLRAALSTQAQVWIVLFDVPGRSRWAGRQLRDNLKLWAAAYGRALIFSGRGAGSLLESPTGRVMTQTREEPSAAVTADLEIPPPFGAETLYARLGDWWPVAMGVVALFFTLSERLQRVYGGPRRFNS